tara:strand:+ start:282 stop:803 length:522 start_codon:yes stop_codon:yes gene_type:complete
MNVKHLSIILVIFIAALSRLIPHPPNFTPIIAIGLFSGFYFNNNKVLAILVPFSAMLIADIFLGFHFISLFVYLGLLLIVFVGFIIPNHNGTTSFDNVLCGSLGGSLTFFIISNFGVFLIGYPKSISGFIACYTAAIPFFQTSIMADLLFTTVIFLSYDVIRANVYSLNADSA